MNRPQVSCVIATRDRWDLLQRALASARGEGVEIVVVDDGSTDATATLGPSLPGLTWIRAHGGGAAAARNLGAAASTGEWLAFLDDDDEWLPGKLDRQLAALGTAAFGTTGWREVMADGATVDHPGPERPPWGRLLQGNFVNTSTVLIRRDLFRQVGGFDESLRSAEDWDLWLRAARESPLVHVPEILTRSYVRGGPRLTGDSERLWRDALRVQERFLRLAPRDWRGPVRRSYADARLRAARSAWARGARTTALRDLWLAVRTDAAYCLRHFLRQGLRLRSQTPHAQPPPSNGARES